MDGSTVSESNATNNESSNSAAPEAEVEAMKNSEGTNGRSTVAAIPETTTTTNTTDGIPESNRRSTTATRPGRSILRSNFNSVSSGARTPPWWPKTPWTLEQLQKRKASQEAGSGELEDNVPEVPESHTPSSASRSFDNKKGFPPLSLSARMAQRSNPTNTALPSPTSVGLRRGTMSGQRPNILGDSPRTGIAASPIFNAAGFSTGFRDSFRQATSTPRSAHRPRKASNLGLRPEEIQDFPDEDEVGPSDEAA